MGIRTMGLVAALCASLGCAGEVSKDICPAVTECETYQWDVEAELAELPPEEHDAFLRCAVEVFAETCEQRECRDPDGCPR